MARHTGPKNKLARRFGQDLGLKTNPLKVARRLALRPGAHGRKRARKPTGYGIQLAEKQKLRLTYGLTEKALVRLYAVAIKTPAATGQALLKLVERRLDNVVYRLGLAPTRAAARQFVNHGHVQVNGQKSSIPSMLINVGDTISLQGSAASIPYVAELLNSSAGTLPTWLERQGTTGKVVALPESDELNNFIDVQLVVEYYSR